MPRAGSKPRPRADAPDDAAKWMPPRDRPPPPWVPKLPVPWTRANLAAAASLGEFVMLLMPDGSVSHGRGDTWVANLQVAVAGCVGSGPWRSVAG